MTESNHHRLVRLDGGREWALVGQAFQTFEAERVFGEVFVDNVGSRRVLEKLGFRQEARFHRRVFKGGQWLDAWIMAITRDEWVKAYPVA